MDFVSSVAGSRGGVLRCVCAVMGLAALAAGSCLAHEGHGDRGAFARVAPEVGRSVVMVKVVAHPQIRVNGINQPPRTFDLEGPATVIASGGVVVSSQSIFDPIRGFPPRDGVEFGATVYSKVQVLLETGDWIEARVAATADQEDLVFFVPAVAADGERLHPIVCGHTTSATLFDEYLDVTRAPATFERCLISRIAMVTGATPHAPYVFVTSLSTGSPVVDAEGVMLGLGVGVPSPGMPASSALLLAPRLMEIAAEKGLLEAAPAP